MEIMIHPGNAEIDKKSEIEYEKKSLLSEYRNKESDLNFK